MEAARWLLLVFAGFSGSQFVDSTDWDYEDNGPSTWPVNYPTCGGNMQSPVNIKKLPVSGSLLPPLVYKGYWDSDVEATLSNNGHSAEVTVEDWSSPATLSGGPLLGRYVFANLHFHWGAVSSEGSEHTLFQQRFSMEAHVVHFKEEYGNVTNAYEHADGIAVVAFFLEVLLGPNENLSDLTDAVPQIVDPESSTPLPLTAATQWFHDRATAGDYLTYHGSLTTPPCYQVVTWIIYPLSVTLSEDQVAVFRRLKTSSGSLLLSNYRPTQDLNGRLVRLALPKVDLSMLNHLGEGYRRA